MMGDDFNITDYLRRMRFKAIEPTDANIVYKHTMHRIRHERMRKADAVSRRWKYASIAASLAFVALLSYHLLAPSGIQEGAPVEEKPVYTETTALPGAKVCVDLPDGSKAWLNSTASIRYAQPFGADGRKVEVRGEALFEVKKDAGSPFIVSAGGMSIEVTGTVFNVYALPSGSCTEVTLMEGAVKLYKSGNETDAADYVMHPDQQAVYNRETGSISVSEVKATSYSSWVSQEFIFEKASMEDIARELERAFSVRIHIENDSIGKIQLNARFTHKESLDKILSILRIPAGFACIKKEGEIYIR
jgi:ferric-dicitrate binding protein FerR (iron transport regulator)